MTSHLSTSIFRFNYYALRKFDKRRWRIGINESVSMPKMPEADLGVAANLLFSY